MSEREKFEEWMKSPADRDSFTRFAWEIWQACSAENQKEIDALQAKIDELMLDHCPNEMTQEQMARWAKSQASVQWRTVK